MKMGINKTKVDLVGSRQRLNKIMTDTEKKKSIFLLMISDLNKLHMVNF